MKRGNYKKTVKSCAHCGKEFEGTARAKYCTRSHSVLATRTRLGQISTWELLKQLKAENARLLAEVDELRSLNSVPVAAPVRVAQPVVSVPAVKKIETPVVTVLEDKPDIPLRNIKSFVSRTGFFAEDIKAAGYNPDDFYETIQRGETSPSIKSWRGEVVFKGTKVGKKWMTRVSRDSGRRWEDH